MPTVNQAEHKERAPKISAARVAQEIAQLRTAALRLTYHIEQKNLRVNFFRHRIVSSDGRFGRWAPYSGISGVDGMYSVTPFHDPKSKEIRILTARQLGDLMAQVSVSKIGTGK